MVTYPGTPEQRAALRQYHREMDRFRAACERIDRERDRIRASHRFVRFVKTRRGIRLKIVNPALPDFPEYPILPKECWYMSCGARTRNGTPCKRLDIFENGRCKFHGGISTGPRTKRGKRRAAMNGFRPGRRNEVHGHLTKTDSVNARTPWAIDEC